MRDTDDTQRLLRVDAERQRAENLLRIERDLSIAISSAPNLDDALRRLLATTCQIEGVDSGGVYVVDHTTGGLHLAVHQGLPDWFVERVSDFDADADETGLVMAGKPFYYLSPNAPSGDMTIHRREGLRAVAVIPVLHDGDVVACINLGSHTHEQVPLSTRHALEGIASQIGGVLARIRAEEALREAQRDLHILVEKRTAELQAANRALNEEIEEHRRSEKALRESEWRYHAIFDQTFQLMGIMTTDGILTEVNRTALEFGGLTEADVLDKPFWEAPWWTHSEALQETLRTAVARAAAGELIRFEAWHPGRGGRMRYVDVSIRPVMDAAGNVVLLIPEGRDISEKHEAEEARLRTEKLEAIGVLAGGIAHDFNNLLAGIITNVSLAKLSSIDPEVLRALSDSERAALRASRLTDQLLTFSKGGAPVKTVAVLSDVIRETAAFALSGSNTRCQFDLPEDPWPVEVDISQIGQVIQNLVLNASEAMPSGGVIAVAAQGVRLDAGELPPLAAGRYLRIVIADQGVGIPAKTLDRIFDPYFSTKPKGSGLGLAIAHSVISGHGGHIRVESQEGAGTTSELFLPASERTAPGRKEPATGTLAGQGRILLMDDEGVIRRGARRMLGEIGYSVVCAREGSEAIELYLQAQRDGEPFDAVVLDLTVPAGMGGAECIRRLLKIEPDVRAVVSSGYSTDPIVANFRKHGFLGFVRKPYTLEDMATALSEVMA